ncbi:HD-GYP domain-containing protein [Pseudocolwellia sp. HL-MZ19]|uniref:HD-GYP domain-containing protein n=1 Tax=Pseudocolwellia sp. HL-MZ19 TaxID=3400846 RepID=UPI003CF4E93C
MQNTLSKLIPVKELKLGMYVLEVKSENRFIKIKTKGLVKSDSIIKQLKEQGVTDVFVRNDKAADMVQESTIDETPEEEITPTSIDADSPEKIPQPTPKKVTVAEEFHQSCKVYDNATNTIKAIFDDISADQKINITAINELANDITDSILRNEYAISILTRIREKDTYQWEHAINTAILVCGFSLFIGMKKETATQIAIGALLHDVGVAKLPKALLNKKEKLTTNEQTLVEKHVLWGHQICSNDGLSNKITTDMLVNHHERLDGSGYPRGLKGAKLSKLARITAIVDVYDAMTGNKHYKKGEQPINALRYLISKNEKFDRSLVQQFIKYIGVHPVGSLVKLSNETLAIVTEGNRNDPLNPTAIAFYNTKVGANITSKKYILDEEALSITTAARPEDYQINIAKVIRKILT